MSTLSRGPETLNHLFRECVFTCCLWSLITAPPDTISYQDLDFQSWLKAHCTYKAASYTNGWSTMFSFTIWAIWYFRNQLVHNKHHSSVSEVKDFVYKKVGEFNQALNSPSTRNSSITIHVGWAAPSSGFIKLNTDGSALGNPGLAGAGGVFRDELGRWILGFSHHVGHTSSLAAELWAIRDGLSIALSKGFNKIVLETDSKIAMALIDKCNCDYHSLGTLVTDCRILLGHIPDLQIKHIYREANAVADQLAKKGAKSTNHFVMYNSCPTDLGHILYSDIIGNLFPRTVVPI
ncbi:hypothetical protein SLA2020_349680 [Shorea laevis]